MGWGKDEKFECHVDSLKNQIFMGGGEGGVGGHENTIYRGNCLKREAWSVCKFKGGGLAKKEVDGVFEGGGRVIPQCILWQHFSSLLIWSTLLCFK